MCNARSIWLCCLMFSALTGFSQIEKSDTSNDPLGFKGYNFECSDDCPTLTFSNVSKALSKDRQTIGIGEEVNLRMEGNHSDWCGLVVWSVDDLSLGILNTNIGNVNILRTNMKEGVIKVTATLLSPSANCTQIECPLSFSISFTIIKPTDIFFQFSADPPPACINGNVRHRNDFVSTGYWGQYFLLPDHVSFYNLSVGEEVVLASANGYFSDYNGLLHNPAPLVEATDVVVQGKGTFVLGVDNIWIEGWQSSDPLHPLSLGFFSWHIPWKARHMTTLEELDLFVVNHEAASDANGKCTLTKKITVSSNIDDLTNCPN